MPVNVSGRQLALVPYRVAEVETLRIVQIDSPFGEANWFFTEALDADGVRLLGEVEWFVDGSPIELKDGLLELGTGESASLRVRMNRVEATFEP